MSRVSKSIETKSGLVVGCLGLGVVRMKYGVIANRSRISLGGDKNFLKLIVVRLHNPVNILTKESTRLSLLRLEGQATLKAHLPTESTVPEAEVTLGVT